MENTAREIKKYSVEEYYKEVENYSNPTELRNGEIIDLASPSISHQRISGEVYAEFRNYIKQNNGKCRVFSAPTDVKLNENNIIVPDIFVACKPENFDTQKYNGSPEFIAEIVSTNWADDYIRKLALYQENGVREYWIIDPKNLQVTVYFFEEQIAKRYSFDDDILVNIYENNNPNLIININKLIQ